MSPLLRWLLAAAAPLSLLLVLSMAPAIVTRAVSSSAGELRIVYAGETLGYISPCGCSKPMIGGMDRRGALVQRLRRSGPLLLIDTGDLTPASGRQDEIKADTLARMFDAMACDAIGIGEKDLALGLPALAQLQARTRTPFLAANVRDASGNPLFLPYVVVRRTVQGKAQSAAIAAVLSPSEARSAGFVSDEFRIDDPDRALDAIKPAMMKTNLPILLYHGPRDEAVSAARRHPWIRMVLYAHGGDAPAPPLRIGTTVLLCAGSKGKYVGVASFGKGRSPSAVRHMPLEERWGSDGRIRKLRTAYQQRLIDERLLEAVPRTPHPSGQEYAGSQACRSCHAGAYDVWRSSRHTVAMDTLRAEGADRDPECVPCHVTGLHSTGGYAEGRDHLAHVGCESCHGPAAGHAATGGDPLPARSGPEACRACHVPDHSPKFQYDAYWSRIRH